MAACGGIDFEDLTSTTYKLSQLFKNQPEFIQFLSQYGFNIRIVKDANFLLTILS